MNLRTLTRTNHIEMDANPILAVLGAIIIMWLAVAVPIAFGAALGGLALMFAYPLITPKALAVGQFAAANIAAVFDGNVGATPLDLIALLVVMALTLVWRREPTSPRRTRRQTPTPAPATEPDIVVENIERN